MINKFVLHLRELRPQEAIIWPSSLSLFASNMLCDPGCLLLSVSQEESSGHLPFFCPSQSCWLDEWSPGNGQVVWAGWPLVFASYREAVAVTCHWLQLQLHLGIVSPQEIGSQPLPLVCTVPRLVQTDGPMEGSKVCIKGRKSVALELSTSYAYTRTHCTLAPILWKEEARLCDVVSCLDS